MTEEELIVKLVKALDELVSTRHDIKGNNRYFTSIRESEEVTDIVGEALEEANRYFVAD